jgi:hypothetical protein
MPLRHAFRAYLLKNAFTFETCLRHVPLSHAFQLMPYYAPRIYRQFPQHHTRAWGTIIIMHLENIYRVLPTLFLSEMVQTNMTKKFA